MRITNGHSVFEMTPANTAAKVGFQAKVNKAASNTAAQPSDDQVALAGGARVAELKRRYQEGSYKVDPQAVSSKIVDRHID